MKAYSAGLMSQSFWFIEFKKVVKLVSDGKSQNDIKAACCFSERMRKVFRKNEKSMLQNCNKKAKKKRALTTG